MDRQMLLWTRMLDECLGRVDENVKYKFDDKVEALLKEFEEKTARWRPTYDLMFEELDASPARFELDDPFELYGVKFDRAVIYDKNCLIQDFVSAVNNCTGRDEHGESNVALRISTSYIHRSDMSET